VGPLRARVKSAKVRPTPYVYYPVAEMSQSNVPASKLDHLDLLVCKLTILTCQSANSSILQT
jgi:hypothetical protein